MTASIEHALQNAQRLLTTGQVDAAMQLYSQILSTHPHILSARLNLGTALFRQGHIDAAQHNFSLAIKIAPTNPDAQHCMGQLLSSKKEYKNAINHLKIAAHSKPNGTQILSNLVFCLQQVCDWNELEAYSQLLSEKQELALSEGQSLETPYASLVRTPDPKENQRVARTFATKLASTNLKTPPKDSKKSPTIGYIGGNFNTHPIGYHLRDIVSQHRLKTHIYSYTKPEESPMYKFYNSNQYFHQLHNKSLDDCITTIKNNKVDILIDTTGWTQNHRVAICLQKPSPIIINYLGFPGSMGSPLYDYIITDNILTPQKFQKYYDEKFAYLPHCYLPQSYNNVRSLPTAHKKDHKLPDGHFIFSCFNNPYKISREVLTAWMEILNKVPQSVLWLRLVDGLGKKNLQLAAKKHGVDKNRLIFSPKISFKDHLTRHQLADLALDTWDYNGGATSSNALFANTPILTLTGNRYVSRMTTSMLTTLDMSELITNTKKDYVEKAIDLAKDPNKIKKLKAKLTSMRHSSSFFNTSTYVNNLEKLYLDIWNTHDYRTG